MKNVCILLGLTILVSCSLEKMLKNADSSELTSALKTVESDNLADALEEKDPDMLQDRGTQMKEDSLKKNWPKKHSYNIGELGFVLQDEFRSHAEICGFTFGDGALIKKKDFLPADLTKFVSASSLTRPAEAADISGNGLFFYMFHENEMDDEFVGKKFSAQKIIDLGTTDQFLVASSPNANFDSYFITKTCRGFLDASLEAGVEPPYTSFKAALETKDRREASIILVSGRFVSPIEELLKSTESKTRLYLSVWQKYTEYPTYIGKAQYLSEFEGVMVKRIASSEEFNELKLNGKLDFSGSMNTQLKGQIDFGSGSSELFTARDWETILITDFDSISYKREDLYKPLPNATDIAEFFNSIQPALESPPEMVQGGVHELAVIYEGIPEELSDPTDWKIQMYPQELYKSPPVLTTNHYTKDGKIFTKFIISGIPKDKYFEDTNSDNEVNVNYRIESAKSLLEEDIHLEIEFHPTIGLSKHPIPNVPQLASWEPYRLPNHQDKWGSKWRIRIDFNDHDNEVNFARGCRLKEFEVTNLEGEEYAVSYKVKKGEDGARWIEIILYDPKNRNLSDYSPDVESLYNFRGELEIPVNSTSSVTRTIQCQIPIMKLISSGED